MKKKLLGSLCGALMGLLLAHLGNTVLTWEFWAGMGLMVAYGVNLAAE